MPLPPIESVLVATKATQHYLNRIAAANAGGPQVDFTQGTVRVGDGDGDIPPIADLLAIGNVTHLVASGSWVQGVTVNPDDPAQTDVLCVIPAVDGTGNEIGPFWVTEFAITDENGAVCLVGTTAMAKLVSSNGGLSELGFIAAEKLSNGAVILSPPAASFVTLIQVINLINSAIPTVEAPLLRETTLLPSGLLRVLLKLRAATQALVGYGRPATDDEFAAGEAAAGTGVYQFPWPTLQQVKDAIQAIPGVNAPLTYDSEANKYGAAIASANELRAGDIDTKVVTPKTLADAAAFQNLADGATINWNAALGFNARVTLNGNRTLAAPTNLKEGVTYSLVVIQGGGGNRTLAFNAAYDFGPAGAPPLSSAGGKADLITAQCLQVSPPLLRCTLARAG